MLLIHGSQHVYYPTLAAAKATVQYWRHHIYLLHHWWMPTFYLSYKKSKEDISNTDQQQITASTGLCLAYKQLKSIRLHS